MQVTIDRLGRLVVPKPVRDKLHLHAGAVMDLVPEVDGIRLSVMKPEGGLIQEHGVLVHHGPATIDLDIAHFINTERESRNGFLVAEHPAS